MRDLLRHDIDFSSPEYRDFRRWKISRLLSFTSRYVDFTGKSVLDAGCGRGESAEIIRCMGARRVVALDLDWKKLRRARQNNPDAVLLAADGTHDLPIDRQAYFDCVVSLDTLEHVVEPGYFLKNLIDHTRPGGEVVIEFSHYDSIIGHHLVRFTWLPVHLLPRKWMEFTLRWAMKRRYGSDYEAKYEATLRGWQALNRLTRQRFSQMLQQHDCGLEGEFFVWHIPQAGWFPFKPLKGLEKLQAFVAFNTVVILRKP